MDFQFGVKKLKNSERRFSFYIFNASIIRVIACFPQVLADQVKTSALYMLSIISYAL